MTPSAPPPQPARFDARRDASLRALGFLLLFATLAGALLVSFLVTPEDIESGRVVLSPLCPSRRWFGIECPSCGLTRAFAALSHGRLGAALAYNRGAPVVYAAFWLGAAAALVALARALRERLALTSSTRWPDRSS